MAALTITAANVFAAADVSTKVVTSGATVTAGMAVYKDLADGNKYKGCTTASAAAALCAGIALNGGTDGQRLTIGMSGDITIGDTVVVGSTYYVGAAAGNDGLIEPDVGSGDFVTILGVAISASVIRLRINVSGVDVP